MSLIFHFPFSKIWRRQILHYDQNPQQHDIFDISNKATVNAKHKLSPIFHFWFWTYTFSGIGCFVLVSSDWNSVTESPFYLFWTIPVLAHFCLKQCAKRTHGIILRSVLICSYLTFCDLNMWYSPALNAFNLKIYTFHTIKKLWIDALSWVLKSNWPIIALGIKNSTIHLLTLVYHLTYDR